VGVVGEGGGGEVEGEVGHAEEGAGFVNWVWLIRHNVFYQRAITISRDMCVMKLGLCLSGCLEDIPIEIRDVKELYFRSSAERTLVSRWKLG